MVYTLTNPSSNNIVPGEFKTEVPAIYVNGVLNKSFDVISVTQNLGVLPGTCTLRVNREIPGANRVNPNMAIGEIDGPTTLNMRAFGWDSRIRAGASVAVIYKGTPIFMGALMTRADTGSNDEVIWKCQDHRIQLGYIPLRGQVVRDPKDSKLKHIRSRATIFNPNGNWNCTGALVTLPGPTEGSTVQYTVPVFADIAQNPKLLDTQVDNYATLEVGKLTPWTPKRALQYLAFIMQISNTGLNANPICDGIDGSWRSLVDSNTIHLDLAKWMLLSASDVGYTDGAYDPLDLKMPPLSIQGKTLQGALEAILAIPGTHQLQFNYTVEEQIVTPAVVSPPTPAVTKTVYYSDMNLVPTYLNGLIQGPDMNIPILIGGKPSDLPDCNTVYDFQAYDDWSNVASAILMEGDSVKVEGLLTTEGGSIIPGWSTAEEVGFQTVINGQDTGDYFAKIPAAQTQPGDTITWLASDGIAGRPLAYRFTREAVALARLYFPNVYRKFFIDSTTNECKTLLAGANSEYASLDKYPVLSNRAVLDKQLQYLLTDPSNTGNEENYTRTNYPIRLIFQESFRGHNSTIWKDTEAGPVSIQLGNDNSFFLDHAEAHDNQYTCLYQGVLFNSSPLALPEPLQVKLRKFGLNIAIYMDHRVMAYDDVNTQRSTAKGGYTSPVPGPTTQPRGVFADSFAEDLGGQPMRYIDSEGYTELHQVNSTPSPNLKFVDPEGTGTPPVKTAPLTRLLPNGNNRLDLEQQAKKKLFEAKISSRMSSFKIIGIRPDKYKIGNWVHKIEQFMGDGNGGAWPVTESVGGETTGTADYLIDDNIRTITFNFGGNESAERYTQVSFRSETGNNL